MNLWLLGLGKDSQGVWEGHVHTTIFKMSNQQGPIVQHMKLCSMLCGSLDGRGSLRKNGYMYMYGRSPEATTILLISYTSIQKKSFKVWRGKTLPPCMQQQECTQRQETDKTNGVCPQKEARAAVPRCPLQVVAGLPRAWHVNVTGGQAAVQIWILRVQFREPNFLMLFQVMLALLVLGPNLLQQGSAGYLLLCHLHTTQSHEKQLFPCHGSVS